MFVGGSLLILFSSLWIGVEAQSLPDWYPRIRQEFDNLEIPLTACRKRNNIAPRDGSGCRSRSKTCFFGNQTCGSGAGGFSYPDERCACDEKLGITKSTWTCQPAVCPGAKSDNVKQPEQCHDAIIKSLPWMDSLDPRFGDDCVDFGRLDFCGLFGGITDVHSDLTADEACCACGGGARDAIDDSRCTNLPVILDPPLAWTDSDGNNCGWYNTDAQTRCIQFANELDPILNLTVGEACCACKGITPSSAAPTTCTDLEGWTTANNRTCSQMTQLDCQGFSDIGFVQTENFGFTPSEACCQCGGGSTNLATPAVLNAPREPHTSGLCSSNSSKFNMCVKISPNVAQNDVAAIDVAQSRWSSVIVADNPDIGLIFEGLDANDGPLLGDSHDPPGDLADFHATFCGFDPGFPVDTFDDLNVCIGQLINNNSPSILASSLPVMADNFTRFGVIELNGDSIGSIRNTSPTALTDLLLHELGDVLGIGTLWESSNAFTGAQLQDPTNCTYIGESANFVYQQISGCPETATVPLFQSDGTNPNILDTDSFFCPTRVSKQCFGTELVSPRALSSERSLSPVAVAFLEDLGYTVDYSQGGAFDKNDLDPSCVCDGTTSNGRLMEQEEEEPMIPAKRQLSQKGLDIITVYAEKKLKALTGVAMSYMMKNDEDMSIGIPGMMVAYMEVGEIHTVYVRNPANYVHY